jgi:hypothetical protein
MGWGLLSPSWRQNPLPSPPPRRRGRGGCETTSKPVGTPSDPDPGIGGRGPAVGDVDGVVADEPPRPRMPRPQRPLQLLLRLLRGIGERLAGWAGSMRGVETPWSGLGGARWAGRVRRFARTAGNAGEIGGFRRFSGVLVREGGAQDCGALNVDARKSRSASSCERVQDARRCGALNVAHLERWKILNVGKKNPGLDDPGQAQHPVWRFVRAPPLTATPPRSGRPRTGCNTLRRSR